MNLGIEASKTKKRQTVKCSRKGLSKGFPKPVAGTSREEGEEEGGEEQAGDEERELQKDPLKGKIRESLPDEYLQRVMKWKATCYTHILLTELLTELLTSGLVMHYSLSNERLRVSNALLSCTTL